MSLILLLNPKSFTAATIPGGSLGSGSAGGGWLPKGSLRKKKKKPKYKEVIVRHLNGKDIIEVNVQFGDAEREKLDRWKEEEELLLLKILEDL